MTTASDSAMPSSICSVSSAPRATLGSSAPRATSLISWLRSSTRRRLRHSWTQLVAPRGSDLYLLSVLGSQGDAGQFRTPRHIIDFMVEIIDPKKTETLLDPACGTAGFLISSYKHILEANVDANGSSTLTPDEKGRLAQNFKGYDISPDMVRLSLVNMCNGPQTLGTKKAFC